VRTDKTSSLKQRLRREADAFEFNALIEGVSTLEVEEGTTDPAAADGPLYGTPIPPVVPAPESDAERATGTARAASIGETTTMTAVALSHPIAPRPTASYGTRAADREERLRSILDALGRRLLDEAALLRSAMLHCDAIAAGERLARINQLCELLHSVDPSGDLARQLGATAAPPDSRPWPSTSWSAAEFATSPFSALVPASAPASFLADLMYAAWDVKIDRPSGVG
jgi:hypothetical protein